MTQEITLQGTMFRQAKRVNSLFWFGAIGGIINLLWLPIAMLPPTRPIHALTELVIFITPIFWLLSLIGLVLAYIYKSKVNDLIADHLRYHIRTFWLSIAYSIVMGLVFATIVVVSQQPAQSDVIISMIASGIIVVFQVGRLHKSRQLMTQHLPLPDPKALWI